MSGHSLRSAVSRNDGSDDTVAVVVRVRPLLAHEIKRRSREVASVSPDCSSVSLNIATHKESRDVKSFKFNYVAPPPESQQEFFEHCGVTELLDSALDGYAGTVFAYGQTGSGKTYSISGSEATAAEGASGMADGRRALQDSDGIIPRAVEYLFDAMESREAASKESDNADELSYVVHTSFFEIYNELVFDLLAKDGASPSRRNSSVSSNHERAFRVGQENLLATELAQKFSLPVRYDEDKKGFHVQGLTSKLCKGKAQVLRAFARGFINRRRGSHKLNEDSSRSHAIMTLDIDIVTTAKVGSMSSQSLHKHGKIVFVDLVSAILAATVVLSSWHA